MGRKERKGEGKERKIYSEGIEGGIEAGVRKAITGLMAARGRKDNGEINRKDDVKQKKDCGRPGRPGVTWKETERKETYTKEKDKRRSIIDGRKENA